MFKNYLAIAWRNLRRNKVFSFINISGLAVGIAASLMLFIIVRYELSYDTFQANYSRLYHIVTKNNFSSGITYNPGIAYPALDALRTDMPDVKFAAINCTYGSQVTVSATNQNSKKFIENKGIFFCEPQFFSLFNSYQWLEGNAASLNEPNSIVLSKSTAEKYFGNWQNAVGKTLKIDNAISAKVTGILQDVPQNTDLPLLVLVSFSTLKNYAYLYNYSTDWGNINSNHQIFALLPKGITEADMNKRLLQFGNAHYKRINVTNTTSNFLQPLSEMHFDTRFDLFGEPSVSRSVLWTLSIIGFVIIIMACINFINLSTAQAVNRSKEVGIRKVLGSNRTSLFIQMMGETALIVSLAVIIALALVQVSLPYIKHIASIEENLSVFTLPTLSSLLALAVLVTGLAGLYPAFVLSGFNPITAIRNKISNKQSGGISVRRGLVVMQFAISQVLIIATIVAVSQMNFINKVALGFEKEAVLILSNNGDSASVAKLTSFKQQLLSLQGVQSVSLNSDAPSSVNSWSTNFAYNHLPDESYQIYLKFGDEDYLKTYGMQLSAGRNIAPSDTINEVLVNETLAKKLSIKQPDAVIGKNIRVGGENWHTIVGVVKDFKAASLRSEIKPMLISTNKDNYFNIAIKLRTGNLTTAQNNIQNAWNQTFPEYAYNAQFFDDSINSFYKQEQQLSLLYKIFAGLAIFISCLGLYGLVSFMAVQKTKELGIRKVLGARVSHIVYIFSKEFTLLIIIAFAIAAPVAWYISSSWLQNFAYKINIGVWIFIVAMITSVVIAWLTVGYKAVAAAVVNPVKSLRTE